LADNFTIEAVTTPGEIAAADDIAGAKYQRVKITLGADGVNGGDVASGNPIPAVEKRATATTRSSTQITADAQILASNASRIRAMFYKGTRISSWARAQRL
jgi:hypothetical protein